MKTNATTPSRLERLLPIIVCSMASFFYIYEFLIRVIPSATAHALMVSFDLHATGLGLLASSFFWGYMPMQVPAGLLYDHFGPRKLLTVSILFCATATVAFGLSTHFALATFCRFIMGFTGAFAFIGPLLIASRWLAPERFSFFTGVVQFLGCMGAIAGLSPIAALSETLGWRHTNLLIAIIGLVFAILMWFIIRDHPPDHPPTAHEEFEQESGRLKQVCHSKTTWWTAIYAFTTWAPITVMATLWGTPFLMSLYSISATQAAGLVSIIWMGIAVGSPLVGWWSNFIKKRRLPMILCSIVGLISTVFVIYGGALPYWLMSILLFLLGFAAAGQVLSFGLVLDNNPDSVMGTAVGFNNMAVITGGILLQPLVGFLLSFYWHHEMRHGIPFYSVFEFHHALAVVPVTCLIGLFVSLWATQETHCQRKFPKTSETHSALDS